MMELRDVTKHYPQGRRMVQALRGVSLRIEAGEFVAIMGPSGSGKSTLMHLLGALDTPTTGQVLFQGRDLRHDVRPRASLLRRTRIGFVFQFFNLLPTLTAAENVALPLLLAGQRRGQAPGAGPRRRWSASAWRDRAEHFPDEMSGGEMQRVAIARALVIEPEAVLCDEPTGNLDSATSQEILELLRSLPEPGKRVGGDGDARRRRRPAYGDRIVHIRDGLVDDEERARPARIMLSVYAEPVSRSAYLTRSDRRAVHAASSFLSIAAGHASPAPHPQPPLPAAAVVRGRPHRRQHRPGRRHAGRHAALNETMARARPCRQPARRRRRPARRQRRVRRAAALADEDRRSSTASRPPCRASCWYGQAPELTATAPSGSIGLRDQCARRQAGPHAAAGEVDAPTAGTRATLVASATLSRHPPARRQGPRTTSPTPARRKSSARAGAAGPKTAERPRRVGTIDAGGRRLPSAATRSSSRPRRRGHSRPEAAARSSRIDLTAASRAPTATRCGSASPTVLAARAPRCARRRSRTSRCRT